MCIRDRIRDAEIKKKSQRVARDVFMLSYYLGGINLTTDWIKNTQTFASHYLYSLLLNVPLSVM